MRALVISDTHFGAWTGRDLLREEFFLERLAPQLEGIDELIFLGDLFDFLFGSVGDAVDAADGLLRPDRRQPGRQAARLPRRQPRPPPRPPRRREPARGAAGRRAGAAAERRARARRGLARPRLLPLLPRPPPARGRDRDRLPDLQLRRRALHPRPLPRPPRPPLRLARRPPADPGALGHRHRRPGGPEDDRGLRVDDHAADRVALHRRPDAARDPRPAERLPRRAAGRAPRPRRSACRCAAPSGSPPSCATAASASRV